MKKALVILFLYATPAMSFVGEQAVYRITVQDASVIQTYTETLKVLSYNKTAKMYHIQEMQTRSGSRDVLRTYQTSEENLLRLKQTFNSCASLEGVREVIEVSGKTFNACSLPVSGDFEDGVVYYGETPFGIIKKETTVPGTKVIRIRELVD